MCEREGSWCCRGTFVGDAIAKRCVADKEMVKEKVEKK